MDVFYFERRGAYGRYLRQNPSHSTYVNKGINRAVDECRNLFKYNRWDCRSDNKYEPFGDVVRKGNESENHRPFQKMPNKAPR